MCVWGGGGGGGLHRNSVIRILDRPDMTSDVYRKAINQMLKQTKSVIRGLSKKVVDFLNSKKSCRAIMFIFCRTIGLPFFNILSVLIDKKINRNNFYVHSISVRYASLAHVKN